MHIHALMVTLALAFPTLAASKSTRLRVDHKEEEVPSLIFTHHPAVQRLSNNIGNISLLSRRASPPRIRTPSPKTARSGTANNNRAFQPELWEPVTSAPVPHTTYAHAAGNRFASLDASHNSYSYRLPSNHAHQNIASHDMRSSASVENKSAKAMGTVEAQGQKLKIKSKISNGRALFRAYGPGSVRTTLEGMSTQGNDLQSLGHANLAIGQQQEFAIQPHSKLTGEMHFNPSERTLPRIEGVLDGEGKISVKAEDA